MEITNFINTNFNKIPTRFDDIKKDIQKAKMDKYFHQKVPKLKEGTYIIGDLFGKVLNKVI